MNEQTISLLLLSVVLLGFVAFLSLAPPSVYQMTVPCKWMADKILFGGRVDYYCYLNLRPNSSGTYSYYLYLPGNTSNLKYATIGIFDVSTPTETINISGSLAPDSIDRLSISIPEYASDIAIYGKIIGKDKDGDYPDEPYIKGGTSDLLCGIECKFDQGLIINRPGTYTLEIYSGRGGNGIDYQIYGSYKLPPASLTVTYDDTTLLHIDKVNYVTKVDVTNKITKPAGYLTFDITGKPSFRLAFEAKMTCSLSGGEWTCQAFYQKGENHTTVMCTRLISSSCNFKGLVAEIPLDLPGSFSTYFNDATSAHVEIGAKVVNVQPGALSFLTTDLPSGDYIIKLIFTVPYLIPEAKQASGQCIFDRNSIDIYGRPGESGQTTISIYNMGDNNVLVKVYPSKSIQDYIRITPFQQVIPPKTSVSFNVDIHLPEVPTEISGSIIVEGCSNTPINIPVTISTKPSKLWFVENLPSIIIVLFSILFIFINRRTLEKYLGRPLSYLVAIALSIFVAFLFLYLAPITLPS